MLDEIDDWVDDEDDDDGASDDGGHGATRAAAAVFHVHHVRPRTRPPLGVPRRAVVREGVVVIATVSHQRRFFLLLLRPIVIVSTVGRVGLTLRVGVSFVVVVPVEMTDVVSSPAVVASLSISPVYESDRWYSASSIISFPVDVMVISVEMIGAIMPIIILFGAK